MASDNADVATVGKMEIYANRDLAVQYGVTSAPTTLLFKNGEVVMRFQGYRAKDEFQQAIDAQVEV